MDEIIISCPHCDGSIIVSRSDIACGIFRHGILNPHSSKDICDKYAKNNQNWGCGKPFKLSVDGRVEICDYI